MALIPQYPKGSDLTILNASYHYPKRNEETGRYDKDFIAIVYKDNITNKKYHEIIYEPEYTFYKANDDVPIYHNMFYIDKEKVHPITCKFKDLQKTIAEVTDNLEFFYENIRAGNRRANKALNTIPSIFGTDSNIEDYYRAQFAKEYINEISKIDKGYFDIEVDTKRMRGDFPMLGECPINAVSYIDDKTNTVNVFLLRDIVGDNPKIEKFETENFSNEQSARKLFSELQQFIIENVGGKEKAEKYKVDNLNFQFMFFDNEVELISTLFKIINYNKPDFMLAWNMAFDIPYIIERCKALNLDPALILSSHEYVEKYANYFIDEQHKNEYELRGDYYDIAADTVYIDQLIQFASRRKGQAAFPNFKLDTAADIITKGAVRKLDYSHITRNISDLPYKDYKTFVFYNIMDTVAQKCIEVTVEDVDYIFATCVINDTRYSKGHRQTVYLANRAKKFFYQQGYILGNNCNSGESVPYEGAMVGDPTHNSDYAKVKDVNQVYNLVDNCDDFDFKSLYPSITREHNMAPDTIVGKILIDHNVNKYENPYYKKSYDRGGQYIEDLVTGNHLEFGKRWLHLADFKELLDDIDEYFETHIPIVHPRVFTENGMIRPFIVRGENCPNKIRPISYLEPGEKIRPFIVCKENDKNVIENVLNSISGQS